MLGASQRGIVRGLHLGLNSPLCSRLLLEALGELRGHLEYRRRH